MGKKARETGRVKTNGAQRDFGGGVGGGGSNEGQGEGEKVTEAVLGL